VRATSGLGEFPFVRIGVLVVAYNAEATLIPTLDRIPPDIVERLTEVLICDDSSTDATLERAYHYRGTRPDLPIHVVGHARNLGYGGNQKAGYRLAIERGLDVVVLLHGDGQYAPEVMGELLSRFDDPTVDAVFGSRMMTPGAARRGGMPLYKFVGNRILTWYQNAVTGAHLSEWHSGYRAYRVSTLARLDLDADSDGFDFDTQIILQLLGARCRIVELPIPTFYGDEISHVNGVRYARQIVGHCTRYALTQRRHARRGRSQGRRGDD